MTPFTKHYTLRIHTLLLKTVYIGSRVISVSRKGNERGDQHEDRGYPSVSILKISIFNKNGQELEVYHLSILYVRKKTK